MKAAIDVLYCEMVGNVMRWGERVTENRNGETVRLYPVHRSFSRAPLVGVRKTAWITALREFEWFLSGSNNVHHLHPSARPWWDAWADGYGTVKYNYGQQLRRWEESHPRAHGGYDQIAGLVEGLKAKPHGRRHVVTTWNAREMNAADCPITNCHNTVTQLWVSPAKDLTMFTYQRSCDLICGVPHNWIQQWAFLLWLARETGTTARRLEWTGGDVHVYKAHYDLAEKILGVPDTRPTPGLCISPDPGPFLAADFALTDHPYDPVLTDKADLVV